MRIEIPETAVVALVGVSGCGKSTFARAHFKPTEVLSSDYFRGLVSNDENNQQVTPQAFDALYYVANKRLDLGLLTVIDATNVQKHARSSVIRLAKEQDCLAVAIVLDTPERICRERNERRSDRNVGGEGMVVKPFDFISLKGGEILQPAVKCRGVEYLRIIYGPEYLLSGNLERLKKRGLGRKRNLALNEFALGMEALERFTGYEPLHRVHECVFGILALESEPVDPRL
ncbi:MAG: AAA family ATPase [Treponema sp.]|jgi:predicted kinase|nr:AAA family ATPase [Treponema sp.]